MKLASSMQIGACALLFAVTTCFANGASASGDGSFGSNGSIAFARPTGAPLSLDLFAIDGQPSGEHRLTRDSDDELSPSYSPDGSQIAFIRGHYGGAFNLYLMASNGSRVQRLARRAVADRIDAAPSWSPDGTQIALFRSAGTGAPKLYLVRADGRGARVISAAPPALQVARPAWSPDATRVLVSASGSLYAVRVADSRFTQISQLHDTPALSGPRAPAWSPDGRRIAFLRYRPCGRSCELPDLYVMSSSGENVRLLQENAETPTWSPDGRKIAYAKLVNGERRISVFTLSTGSSSELTTGPSDAEPDWQPRCQVHGTSGNDRIFERRGGRLVCALGGRDVVRSAGGDRIFAGPGNDQVSTRNHRFDLVSCGPGVDAVRADLHDHVASDCEHVRRLS